MYTVSVVQLSKTRARSLARAICQRENLSTVQFRVYIRMLCVRGTMLMVPPQTNLTPSERARALPRWAERTWCIIYYACTVLFSIREPARALGTTHHEIHNCVSDNVFNGHGTTAASSQQYSRHTHIFRVRCASSLARRSSARAFGRRTCKHARLRHTHAQLFQRDRLNDARAQVIPRWMASRLFIGFSFPTYSHMFQPHGWDVREQRTDECANCCLRRLIQICVHEFWICSYILYGKISV